MTTYIPKDLLPFHGLIISLAALWGFAYFVAAGFKKEKTFRTWSKKFFLETWRKTLIGIGLSFTLTLPPAMRMVAYYGRPVSLLETFLCGSLLFWVGAMFYNLAVKQEKDFFDWTGELLKKEWRLLLALAIGWCLTPGIWQS